MIFPVQNNIYLYIFSMRILRILKLILAYVKYFEGHIFCFFNFLGDRRLLLILKGLRFPIDLKENNFSEKLSREISNIRWKRLLSEKKISRLKLKIINEIRRDKSNLNAIIKRRFKYLYSEKRKQKWDPNTNGKSQKRNL
jgi:hypothetical protein